MYGSAGKPERNLSEKGEAISDFHTPRSAKVSRGWCGFLCLQQREKYMPGRLVCVDVTFYLDAQPLFAKTNSIFVINYKLS